MGYLRPMPITWSTPAVPNAPSFAKVGQDIVGSVNKTAHAVATWKAEVFPRGTAHPGLYAYVGSEAQGKRYVERWLSHHMPDTSNWRRPGRMPHEG